MSRKFTGGEFCGDNFNNLRIFCGNYLEIIKITGYNIRKICGDKCDKIHLAKFKIS